MKDLEKLLKKLEDAGFGQEHLDLVRGHSEHLQSLNATARDEAKTSRLSAQSLQAKIDDLTAKMEESANGGTSAEKLKLTKLEKQLQDLTDKLDASEKQKAEATKKANDAKLDALIKDALLEKGVAKKHLSSLSKLVKVEISQDADGDFVSSDGKKIIDYVGDYLAGEDHLLDNKLPAGAGTRFVGDTAKQTQNKKPINSFVAKNEAMASGIAELFGKK